MSEVEVDIAETIDRLEEIAETLEDGEVDLTTAKELREEANHGSVRISFRKQPGYVFII